MRVFRALLWCYPAAFREEYGAEMLYAFHEQLDAARGHGLALAAVWLRSLRDALTVAPKEHLHMIGQDIRYTLRTLAGTPAFAAVAILSLALGIGANTAIFSLCNSVLLSALPVVEPERLVILSNPAAQGVSIGTQTGERTLLTYAEFEQLRDGAQAFSGVAATQSALDRWQGRVGGSDTEEIRGRLVSAGYFRVLGAHALIGRTFEDNGPYAVISHNFWRRRFGAEPGVLGAAITVRKATLTVIGVMGPRFFGETVGEPPDVWAPLALQPQILPGRDWLHDTSPEKVMWLHVFGRLKPGVGIAQAQENANAVFKGGLEALYGSTLSAEARKQSLDQKLVARPASGGASNVRARFREPLMVLLAVAGAVLLIACANVSNLLLARATARHREIAVRLSLGATRGRLMRQLLTESLVIAIAGGAAGIAVGYVVHRGLVALLAQAVRDFHIAFSLDARVLAFSFALTVAATLMIGLLPALRATQAGIRGLSRANTQTGGQLRWGRALVVGQIALSLPLLVGAGLFLRTLMNLQNTDLGYSRERLLLLRVDAQSAGYEQARRAPLFRDLLEQVRRLPGVRAASFSENGLFFGRDSGDQIVVEGHTPKGRNDRGSRWDHVGPRYFTSVGIPIRLGREIVESDEAGSPKVCVINEAFAKLFFEGRNPLGMHITTVYGDKRVTHQIVGVAANARTHRLRGDVPHRYFVPLTQPLAEFDSVVFEIRTTRDPEPVLAAVRKIIFASDPNLGIVNAGTMDERLENATAQDRLMARLSMAFGAIALALAAIGLYGVLSYGVVRRQGEIGIRIALGAQPARVVRMVLRETGLLLVAGLAAGLGLALAATRLIASQIYGLTPTDPATLAAAVALLASVALAAAYQPANRASRVDPLTTLRQE